MILKISNNIFFFKKNLIKYISNIVIYKDEITCLIRSNSLFKVLNFLKKNSITRYSLLMDILAIDKPFQQKRFIIVYKLISLTFNSKLYIKINFTQATPIESSLSLYSAAGWLEREVWDFFGIYFFNHTDLRRILTDYGFIGFPMRKDFPLSGYFEILYLDEKKRVILELLDVTQDYRFFNFKSPWE
jgi:NADH:ubiquinone oxidoreductase subunit C